MKGDPLPSSSQKFLKDVFGCVGHKFFLCELITKL